jgi:hypothetical protein
MSVTVKQHKNFIGGEWAESDGVTMEEYTRIKHVAVKLS